LPCCDLEQPISSGGVHHGACALALGVHHRPRLLGLLHLLLFRLPGLRSLLGRFRCFGLLSILGLLRLALLLHLLCRAGCGADCAGSHDFLYGGIDQAVA